MDTTKKHHIRFSLPAGSAHSQITKPTIETRIKTIPGISTAIINFHNNDIKEGEVVVEYDLKKCREEIVERWLVSEGFLLDDPILDKFKRGFLNPQKDIKTNYSHYSPSDSTIKTRKHYSK